jgi:cytochrome b involved in lipid metabolism
MADDRSSPGQQDRVRINVNEEYELRDWSKKFGVTQDQLRDAVKSAGVMAKDVAKHLRKEI